LSGFVNPKDSRLLWERGLQFLGAQTASQSHEVTNVFNIINEMAGLMGDMLYSADQGRPLDTARLTEITTKIAAQIQRGNKIVRAINQFGHSADKPRAVFDLHGMLESIAFIAQRPAVLHKTLLETDFPEASISVESSPLGFQQAVFTAFEIALAAASDKRRITLGYTLVDDGVQLTVHSDDPLGDREEVADKAAFLRLLVSTLGGRVIALAADDDPHRIIFAFPKRMSED
jgi:C4-dicarboxylate-specific signal transduction histidine kinase